MITLMPRCLPGGGTLFSGTRCLIHYCMTSAARAEIEMYGITGIIIIATWIRKGVVGNFDMEFS